MKNNMMIDGIDYSIFDHGIAVFSYQNLPTATIPYDIDLRNHAEKLFDYIWETL